MANADIKQAVTQQAPARTKLQLVRATAKHLRSVQRQAERIRKYFERGPLATRLESISMGPDPWQKNPPLQCAGAPSTDAPVPSGGGAKTLRAGGDTGLQGMFRPMKKLPNKFTPLVLGFWMSLLMAALMCLIVTAINTGIDAELGRRWLQAFVLVWPIAFAVLLVLRPVALRLTAWMVEHPPQ
jgi:hypothetical protein